MSTSDINVGWIEMSASAGRSRIWNHTRGFLRYVGKQNAAAPVLRRPLDLEKKNGLRRISTFTPPSLVQKVYFLSGQVGDTLITAFLVDDEIL